MLRSFEVNGDCSLRCISAIFVGAIQVPETYRKGVNCWSLRAEPFGVCVRMSLFVCTKSKLEYSGITRVQGCGMKCGDGVALHYHLVCWSVFPTYFVFRSPDFYLFVCTVLAITEAVKDKQQNVQGNSQ